MRGPSSGFATLPATISETTRTKPALAVVGVDALEQRQQLR